MPSFLKPSKKIPLKKPLNQPNQPSHLTHLHHLHHLTHLHHLHHLTHLHHLSHLSHLSQPNHLTHLNHLNHLNQPNHFIMNDKFRHLISTNYKESEIMDLAKIGGMKILLEDGLEKVKTGITTPEELLRVIGPITRNEHKCEGCGHFIDRKFLFCPFCGVFKHNICHNCQIPLNQEWQICPFCGKAKTKDQLGLSG